TQHSQPPGCWLTVLLSAITALMATKLSTKMVLLITVSPAAFAALGKRPPVDLKPCQPGSAECERELCWVRVAPLPPCCHRLSWGLVAPWAVAGSGCPGYIATTWLPPFFFVSLRITCLGRLMLPPPNQ